MGKHHRSPTKQSSATTSVQQLRTIIARNLSDSLGLEYQTQLKQWLMKFLPSIGLAATGTSTWKDIRDFICMDHKLLEKLCCVFQDARDSSLILLMAQLFSELLASKRAAKLLVQCGLTLAVLCQIRVCCCLSSNSNPGGNSSSSAAANHNNWQSSSTPSDAVVMSLTASLQCSFLGSSSSTTDLEKQATSSNNTSSNSNNNSGNAGLQCSPQVAIALHQLACRIFPLDSRYNTKARATGAIIGTLMAAKALYLDRKALYTLLCCLRFYLNSAKNLKLLGSNGCVGLMHRLIATMNTRQTRLLKLAVELLSLLLKSSSNCVRIVQCGGVATLFGAFETVHRSDSRCRQLQIRRIILRCLLAVTQIRAGRSAVIQCGAVHTLYAICKELPGRQELDGMYLTAIAIIKNSAGPRRLPVTSLQSPYTFDSSRYASSELSASRAVTNLQSKTVRRPGPQMGVAGASGATPSGQTIKQNPGTDDESVSEDDDMADDDYAEESDFVIENCRNFMRTNSTEDRPDGGCITAADDSESDCDPAGYAAGSQDVAAAMAAVPLESDPVVLASYDMFFPEVRDLSLTNTATSSVSLSENLIMADNLAAVIAGNSSSAPGSGSSNSGLNLPDNDFITHLGIRTSVTSNSNGNVNTTGQFLASAQRKASTIGGQQRKSTGNKPVFSRRSSELNVPETPSSSSSYGYVTNSMTSPVTIVHSDSGSSRISSFLPLSLIGEHIGNSNAERASSFGSGSSNSSNINSSSNNAFGPLGANRDAARYAKLYNTNKRVAIWNKIPYPCLFGFSPNPNPEPQLALPSVNIRRLILSDCERFLQKMPSDIINEVVYDLDEIVATQGVGGMSCESQPLRSSSSLGQNPAVPLGNDDLQRIGRPSLNGDNALMFNSLFECGNLRRAIRVREFEYDLILTPDVSTNHHLQWFYFEIFNTPPASQPIRFNILNCEKPKSQYEKGMQILSFSVTEAALGRPQWRRVGYDVCYYKNYLEHPSGPLPTASYYTVTFTLTFEHSYDVCYLAYHYPYSYTALLYELEGIHCRVLPSDVYYTCQTLCTSEMGNVVPLITITSSVTNLNPSNSSSSLPGISSVQQSSTLPITNSQSSLPSMIASLSGTQSSSSSTIAPIYRTQQQRPYVVITSRVHPGETNSSWMMRGVIAFLLSDTPSARRARQSFVFKIVPMLNIDGVINGNHRCSLYGDDLNRSWTRPSPVIAPSIFHTKRLLAWLRFRRRPILCFIDFHGHSRKKNIFVLGCSPSQSWRRRDVANPAVDPVTGEEDSRWRLLPVLLAATSPTFSLQDCCFMIERAKEPTARVVCWRQVGLIAAYTLEATFCGFDQGSYRGMQVTPAHLQEIGADLIRCFEPLFASMGRCPTPNARYGEAASTAQQNAGVVVNVNGNPTGSSFPAMGSSSATGRGGGDSSSSSSNSRSEVNSVRDENSDDDIDDQMTRRTAVITTKTLTFVTKKY